MNLKKTIKRYVRVNLINENLKLNSDKKHCFIMMACDYGNLGDVAITVAQKEFLLKNLDSEYEIYEIPISKVYAYAKSIKNQINDSDIITIVGGGNSGDLYIDFEEKRRFISKYFNNMCKIISFPQTIEWLNKNNNYEEIKSKNIYSNCNTVFFAREHNSYNYYKDNYKQNRSYLIPDIVLSYDPKISNERSDNVILCLRDDKELANEELITNVKKYVIANYNKVSCLDTKIDDSIININNKEELLFKILNEFSSSKIVVTNRLHGMIFCAITSTPCIVFDNSNHKIKNTYNDWLKEYSFIRFIDSNDLVDINNLKDIIDDCYTKNKINLLEKYIPLIDELKR